MEANQPPNPVRDIPLSIVSIRERVEEFSRTADSPASSAQEPTDADAWELKAELDVLRASRASLLHERRMLRKHVHHWRARALAAEAKERTHQKKESPDGS